MSYSALQRETELRRQAEKHAADMSEYLSHFPYEDEWPLVQQEARDAAELLRSIAAASKEKPFTRARCLRQARRLRWLSR